LQTSFDNVRHGFKWAYLRSYVVENPRNTTVLLWFSANLSTNTLV